MYKKECVQKNAAPVRSVFLGIGHPEGYMTRVAPAAERIRGDFFLNLILFGKSLGLHANRGGAEGTDRD